MALFDISLSTFFDLLPHACVCVCSVMSDSSAIPLPIAYQAPLSMGLPRQEHWSGLPFLLQGILLTQGSDLHLLHFLHGQASSLPLVPPGVTSLEDDKSRNMQDYIKLKGFCMAKKTANKTEKQPAEWEKVFVNDRSNKGLTSKEQLNLTTQYKKKNQLSKKKKWADCDNTEMQDGVGSGK